MNEQVVRANKVSWGVMCIGESQDSTLEKSQHNRGQVIGNSTIETRVWVTHDGNEIRLATVIIHTFYSKHPTVVHAYVSAAGSHASLRHLDRGCI
jgi:hypothetical protein